MSDLKYTQDHLEKILIEGLYGTKWSRWELYLLGEAVLDWCATVATLGHSNPGSTLDYVNGHVGSAPQDFLRDFVAWTSGREHLMPGCEDRIRNEITESGWQKAQMDRLSDRVSEWMDGAAS